MAKNDDDDGPLFTKEGVALTTQLYGPWVWLGSIAWLLSTGRWQWAIGVGVAGPIANEVIYRIVRD